MNITGFILNSKAIACQKTIPYFSWTISSKMALILIYWVMTGTNIIWKNFSHQPKVYTYHHELNLALIVVCPSAHFLPIQQMQDPILHDELVNFFEKRLLNHLFQYHHRKKQQYSKNFFELNSLCINISLLMSICVSAHVYIRINQLYFCFGQYERSIYI